MGKEHNFLKLLPPPVAETLLCSQPNYQPQSHTFKTTLHRLTQKWVNTCLQGFSRALFTEG